MEMEMNWEKESPLTAVPGYGNEVEGFRGDAVKCMERTYLS